MQIIRDFEGRQIRLTDERLAHIQQRHPSLLEIPDAVAATLSEPDFIEPDEIDENVTNYYKWFGGVHTDKLVRIAVVVRESDAFIITAFIERQS